MQSILTTCNEETSSNNLESHVSQDYSNSSHYSHQEMIMNPFVTHSCISTLRTLTPQISFLAMHGNSLYAASLNGINVFDLKDYTLINNVSCSGLVKSIAFIGGKIFTAHQDCKIRVWQIIISSSKRQHQLISTIPTIKDRLMRCFLPKNYVQVRRHRQKLWIEHADTISGLALNNQGLIYSISWDKSFKIWRQSDLCCLESVAAHSDAINAIVVCVNGFVYTASADGSIKVWKNNSAEKRHRLIATLKKHKSSINALAMNNDGSILFSGGFDKNILAWEKQENGNHMKLSLSLKGHSGAILCLTFVDNLLISGSSDKTVRIWRTNKEYCGYSCISVLQGHLKPVKSLVAISSGNSNGVVSIFSGSLDGEIKVWQVAVLD